MEKITIIGAGPVGSLLSIHLARAGFQVFLYEKNGDPRRADANIRLGQSVNITLCHRGLRALDAVGIGDRVQNYTIPLYGRVVHGLSGEPVYQPYGSNREALYAIKRKHLMGILLETAASYDNIQIAFNQKCVDVDLPTATLHLQDISTGKTSIVDANRIIAADGAYSTIRTAMQKQRRFNYSQKYNEQGYKEILLPASCQADWTTAKNALHIWPRSDFLLFGFPNITGSYTLSLHMPFEGELSHKSIQTPAALNHLLSTYFPDVWPFVQDRLEGYFDKPTQTMVTIRCFPWIYQDKVALVGDSCHAIYPYYGQGTNAGFEDCLIIMRYINQYAGNWSQIFREFEQTRKADMDVIADLCCEHLTLLSDRLNNPKYLLRNKVERAMQQVHPDYTSLYHNIAFTSMRYSQALQVEQAYQSFIDRIVAIDDIENKLNRNAAEVLTLFQDQDNSSLSMKPLATCNTAP
ncbi:MAG: NAD(P)/FAD-dependent oxidoreductase [Cyanobacteria bacterium J06626_14]